MLNYQDIQFEIVQFQRSQLFQISLIKIMTNQFPSKSFRIKNVQHRDNQITGSNNSNQQSGNQNMVQILTEVIKNLASSNNQKQTKSINNLDVVDKDTHDFNDLRVNPFDPKRPIPRISDDIKMKLNQNCANLDFITITNENSQQKSKFGQHLKFKLDPRDQILSHPFKFSIKVPSKGNQMGSFLVSQQYKGLCYFIEEYLVDVVENVTSISFNLMMEGKLNENEVKDYAAKNILLNVHSLFKQVMEALLKYRVISKKQCSSLQYDLIQFVDDTLKQVLGNISPYYPQAPPTGGTPRMREALLAIDRSYNEELDFLYTQNLKLTKNEKGEYTDFIMEVVNQVILVSGEIDKEDRSGRTIFQKYVNFSQNLFWLAQEDSYSKIISSLSNEQSTNQSTMISFLWSKPLDLEDRQRKTKQSISLFMKEPSIKKYVAIAEQVGCKNEEMVLPTQFKKQKKIDQMKKQHDFQIGQKLPSTIKPFTKKDIRDKNFSCKHSAVLRVLTKWSQYLEDIFQNPQIYTKNRIYPYKTLKHELIYPSKKHKQSLFTQIKKQKQNLYKIRQKLIKKNKQFQGCFLSKDFTKNVSKVIKRYTQTRTMASKMNALLIQFMKEYVSQLINLLVEAGKTQIKYTEGHSIRTKIDEINLVVFRIGDLMRSKIHCDQATFIRLLKTLYILDQTDSKKHPLFNLVRIKNKLDTKDNNILINYLFKGKIQCQLQMSVQKIAGKQLNYYSYSHFLYELTRGKFGVLSQCATIISQHDPIINSSIGEHYYQAKERKKKKISKNDKNDKNMQLDELQEKKTFICQICGKLKISENIKTFKRQNKEEQESCNSCIIDSFKELLTTTESQKKQQQRIENVQKILSDAQLSNWLLQLIKSNKIARIKSYQTLIDARDQAMIYFFINQSKNQFEYYLTVFEPSDTQFYNIHITKEMQFKVTTNQMVQYQNVTKLIKNKAKIPQFAYLIKAKDDKLLNQIFSRNNDFQEAITKVFVKDGMINFEVLKNIEEVSLNKIVRDSLGNTLKNKHQTLCFSDQKLQFMDQFIQQNSKWIQESLRSIQVISLESLDLTQLRSWLCKCKNLKLVNFSYNSIWNVSMIEEMTEIEELILSFNQIQRIDCTKLTKLRRFNLQDNQLSTLALKDLNYLQQINVSFNQLNYFTAFKLPTLKILNLCYNKINTLELQHLQNLQQLNLADNELLQVNLIGYKHLLKVNLFHNKITNLKVKDLPAVQRLHLSGNPYNLIEMTQLPSLKILKILLKYQSGGTFPKIIADNWNSEGVKVECTPQMYQHLQSQFPLFRLFKV